MSNTWFDIIIYLCLINKRIDIILMIDIYILYHMIIINTNFVCIYLYYLCANTHINMDPHFHMVMMGDGIKKI